MANDDKMMENMNLEDLVMVTGGTSQQGFDYLNEMAKKYGIDTHFEDLGSGNFRGDFSAVIHRMNRSEVRTFKELMYQ